MKKINLRQNCINTTIKFVFSIMLIAAVFVSGGNIFYGVTHVPSHTTNFISGNIDFIDSVNLAFYTKQSYIPLLIPSYITSLIAFLCEIGCIVLAIIFIKKLLIKDSSQKSLIVFGSIMLGLTALSIALNYVTPSLFVNALKDKPDPIYLYCIASNKALYAKVAILFVLLLNVIGLSIFSKQSDRKELGL